MISCPAIRRRLSTAEPNREPVDSRPDNHAGADAASAGKHGKHGKHGRQAGSQRNCLVIRRLRVVNTNW
jgi:hypothetical protein